jgi:hypothetical protein
MGWESFSKEKVYFKTKMTENKGKEGGIAERESCKFIVTILKRPAGLFFRLSVISTAL